MQQRQLDFKLDSRPLSFLPGEYIFQVYFPTIRIRSSAEQSPAGRRESSGFVALSIFFRLPPESCYVIRRACMHTRVLKGHPPSLSESILYCRLARLPYTRHLIYFSQPFRANTRSSSPPEFSSLETLLSNSRSCRNLSCAFGKDPRVRETVTLNSAA